MAIQVYEATKNGEGNPLSVLNRQFISFSYGGKNIEDFGFLAAFTNDRLSKNVYAEFEDTTTNQTELDGQIFWMSSYKPNTLSFSLATDGITEKELETFKAWFIPGTPRELVLTEHANRAIMARVSAAPVMSLLPFEEEIEVQVAGTSVKTRTSLYKGEMTLSFVMDEPHWYSIKSYFEGNVSEEQVKIIYEDDIPHISMFNRKTLLANSMYYNENTISAATGLTINGASDMEQADTNLFYCGTAESKPTISFTTPISFNDEGYAEFPKGGTSENYYLRVGDFVFSFSLPSLLIDYNYALETANTFDGTSALDLRKLFRDNMYDYNMRAYAISILDSMMADSSHTYIDASSLLLADFKEGFNTEIRKFFGDNPTVSFIINSKNGSTVAAYDNDIEEKAGNMIKSGYLVIEPCESKYLSISTNTEMNNFKIDYRYMYL